MRCYDMQWFQCTDFEMQSGLVYILKPVAFSLWSYYHSHSLAYTYACVTISLIVTHHSRKN